MSENDTIRDRPSRVVTEANWQEQFASGVRFLADQLDLDTAEGQEYLRKFQDEFGPEHVVLGSPYDMDEWRPLDHKPGVGIYVTGEGLEKQRAAERQESSGGGPASS